MRAGQTVNSWSRVWSSTLFLIGIFHLFAAQAQDTLTDPTDRMMTPRESHTATLLNDGNVLVAGGTNWQATIGCPAGKLCLSALASAELFNRATGTFSLAGYMSEPRVYHTATLLTNGKVLIAGGDDRKTAVYSTAQLFDPTSGIFTSTGNMMAVRTGHTATLLADGKVLVAGGENTFGSPTGGTTTAELYDPATGKFTPTGNMNVSRSSHTATLLGDGRVLLAGGHSPGSTAEIYNPVSGTFRLTGSMSIARPGHTATLLTSGEVLVTGGQYGAVATATTELFNPVTGIFKPAGNMLSMRESHTATRLADGKVLVTGGINRNRIWSSAEMFDPATGSFTPAGNMETERVQHAATFLANGEVLITGGINFDNAARLNSLATAELSDIGTQPGTVTLHPQAMSFFCHSGVGPPPGCSPPELVTLTNNGSTPVYVLGMVISPANGRYFAFFQTSHCPQVLPPGQSCTIAVWFEGSAAGRDIGFGTSKYTATLYVSDTASSSPQNVKLTGTATYN